MYPRQFRANFRMTSCALHARLQQIKMVVSWFVSFWFCLVRFGSSWFCLACSGFFRFFLVLSGSFWSLCLSPALPGSSALLGFLGAHSPQSEQVIVKTKLQFY